MPTVQKEHIYYASANPALLANMMNGYANVEVFAGKVATQTQVLLNPASTILAVLAFVSASGASATKTLLSVTTDYTINATGTTLTYVTDQSANKLIVIYK